METIEEAVVNIADLHEQLEAGVRVSWLNERQLLLFSLPGSSRRSVQILFDRAIEILNMWPAEHPCPVVLDFTGGNVAATPYARQRGHEMTNMRPELTLFIAFAVPRSIQAQVFQFVVRGSKRRKTRMAVFFSVEEALSWARTLASLD